MKSNRFAEPGSESLSPPSGSDKEHGSHRDHAHTHDLLLQLRRVLRPTASAASRRRARESAPSQSRAARIIDCAITSSPTRSMILSIFSVDTRTVDEVVVFDTCYFRRHPIGCAYCSDRCCAVASRYSPIDGYLADVFDKREDVANGSIIGRGPNLDDEAQIAELWVQLVEIRKRRAIHSSHSILPKGKNVAHHKQRKSFRRPKSSALARTSQPPPPSRTRHRFGRQSEPSVPPESQSPALPVLAREPHEALRCRQEPRLEGELHREDRAERRAERKRQSEIGGVTRLLPCRSASSRFSKHMCKPD